MTEDALRAYLRKLCERDGYLATAQAHGFAASYLSDVVHGRKPPSERLLAALGFERVVSYRRVK